MLLRRGVRIQAVMANQRKALMRLAFMDGAWRGTAWTMLASGEKHTVTQTERIGPFLGGGVKVIEGRGYDADGTVTFNALGIVSYEPGGKQAYSLALVRHGQRRRLRPHAERRRLYDGRFPRGP